MSNFLFKFRRNAGVFSAFLILLLVFAGLAASVSASQTRGIGVVVKSSAGVAQKIPLYDYTAALIIGIDRYANLGPGHQLSYAVRDAKGVDAVLRKDYRFDKIKTLYNEEATKDNIMAALYGFRSLDPDAAVLVYFAGHGITVPGALAGKDLGYLIPYDGELDSIKMYKNISMQQIKSDVCATITAKHVFFIFDACFAGLMLDTRSALAAPSRDSAYLSAITKEQVREVLTAGAKGQTVLDGGPGGHSVFTGRLIQILENVKDYITARELSQRLVKEVYADAAARGHEQRPVEGAIYGTGDFVFVPDVEKKTKQAGNEVRRLEKEVARLKQLKQESLQHKQAASSRELERQRLIKEAELKQARLRQEAAQKEAELKKKTEDALLADKEAKKRYEKEQQERLAYLKKQAKQILETMGGSASSAMGLDQAQNEVKRIRKSISGIRHDYHKELDREIWANHLYYEKQFARASDIAPFDKMFETRNDYQKRRAKAEKKINTLITEKEGQEKAIRKKIEAAFNKDAARLVKQVKQITAQKFAFGPGDIRYSLVSYHPEIESFSVECTVKGIYATGILPMPKQKARTYYHHPELLVASADVVVSDAGEAMPYRLALQGPEGAKYEARISRTIKDKYLGMDFVYVPGGCYKMGCGPWAGNCEDDEKPLHTVCVDGFYIGRYEVTQGQWKKVMGNNPSNFDNCGGDCPVEQVSWLDVQEFIKRIKNRTGKSYRLPTEAEWEYAARSAGKKERYAGGRVLDNLGWYNGNSGGRTHKVGTKAPNGLGIYDMSGNVCEWCRDIYAAYSLHELKNPVYLGEGTYRVNRGGCWDNNPRDCRAAIRYGNDPGGRNGGLGFRLALSPVR